MHPALEKRLKRLHAELMQEEGAALARRSGLRACVAVGASIRRMLVQRGVDPAEIAAMRQVDKAAAELAEMPDGAGGRDAEAASQADSSGVRHGDDFLRELVKLALLHYADASGRTRRAPR